MAKKKAPQRLAGAEESCISPEQEAIIQWFRTVKFRKNLLGGVDEAAMWKKLEELYALYEAAIREFPTASAGILCEAVADFTPETVSGHKIKREKDNLILQLKPTQDIAAALGSQKKEGQILVGFALETNDETKNAQGKLERKNLDFIVLNSLNDQGAGFRCDTNKITIIDRQGVTPYPLKSKQEVARDIIDRLVNNK